MATTQDYINQLKIDKQNLVSMLNDMGVEANNDETFTSLTPKVGKIVSDPILQDKTIEITENGTTTITADEGYDGLNNVSVTTNVASSCNLTANIFVQENEPETKKGLWLETSYDYDVIVNEPHITSTTWISEITRKTIPFAFYGAGGGQRVGNYVYLFGANTSSGNRLAYKYDIINNSYTTLSNVPIEVGNGSSTVIGSDIYISGGVQTGYLVKFNTETETYTTLANAPHSLYGAKLLAVGNYLYAIGNLYSYSYTTQIMQYNPQTNTWKTLSSKTLDTYAMPCPFVIGDYIYLTAMRTWDGGNNVYPSTKAYKFDTINETMIEISSPPTDFFSTTVCVKGNTAYLFGCDTSGRRYINYKYEALSDAYTKMDDLKYEVYHSKTAIAYDDEIMIFGGQGSQTNVLSLYNTNNDTTVYDKNTIVLYENMNPGTKSINFLLFPVPEQFVGFSEHTNYYPSDVQYKTNNNETIDTIPTYYGDGTQWIKFKN